MRASLPLALAAIGETISERAGFINVGLEGAMISGALAATVASIAAGNGAGYGAGALAGAGVGLFLAIFATLFRANQVITGTAITGGALGVTALLSHAALGASGPELAVPVSQPFAVPLLSHVPVLGRAVFAQPPLTYALIVAVPCLGWLLARTRIGLALRATGENPEAVRAAGMSPALIQSGAVVVGSALGGLGGASLVLSQAGTFAEGMTAGRGFIALAVVALGRWRPVAVALAALLFGATTSLQYILQALGSDLPYQIFLALPYLLTLAVLATSGREAAPAWLGRALP